jgi:hypothetical protein
VAQTLWEVLQSHNDQKIKMLEKNMSLCGFIDSLIDYLVQYANHKGVSVEDIVLESPYIGDDEFIRSRIRVNP